jgi:hypothetical protein
VLVRGDERRRRRCWREGEGGQRGGEGRGRADSPRSSSFGRRGRSSGPTPTVEVNLGPRAGRYGDGGRRRVGQSRPARPSKAGRNKGEGSPPPTAAPKARARRTRVAEGTSERGALALVDRGRTPPGRRYPFQDLGQRGGASRASTSGPGETCWPACLSAGFRPASSMSRSAIAERRDPQPNLDSAQRGSLGLGPLPKTPPSSSSICRSPMLNRRWAGQFALCTYRPPRQNSEENNGEGGGALLIAAASRAVLTFCTRLRIHLGPCLPSSFLRKPSHGVFMADQFGRFPGSLRRALTERKQLLLLT